MDIVQRNFLLPIELATKYANIILINHYRIDTFKKRLAYLKFSDFDFMASIILKYFTTENPLEELNGTLAQDARDFKVTFNNKEVQEELKLLITLQLSSLGKVYIMDKCPANTFKALIRNILTIGAGLAHSKEIKDLFTTLQGFFFL